MTQQSVSFVTATLSAQVYDHLLRQISTGVYRPGHPLRERDLVAELGVSRTPIREALLRLIDYGLVEGEGRTARVRRLSVADVRHLFQVRRALELEAVRLACGKLTDEDFARLSAADPGRDPEDPDEFAAACHRLDTEMHRTIAERAGNPLLAAHLRALHDRVLLVCRPVPGRLAEHRAIIGALRANDPRAARRAMTQHLAAALRVQVRTARAAGAVDPPGR